VVSSFLVREENMKEETAYKHRIGQLIALGTRERGQTFAEYALVIGVVAIVMATIFSAIGGLAGESFGELTAALGGQDAVVSQDVYLGPRIAD
jgi:Flp pilus assembly pilin Flp